jgi:16S rRNA (uracil1498-N3)-methyltransferase
MGKIGEIILEGAAIGKTFALEGDALMPVLAWKPIRGSALTVVDGEGETFRARVVLITAERAELLVFEDTGFKRSPLEVTLLQALPEKERMELIIQKTTELGVERIVPFKSEKSISLEERERRSKKAHRWGAVALKAARQSRRRDIPEILPCATFKDALSLAKECSLKVMLKEGPGTGLKEFLRGKGGKRVALLIGPEGGFTEGETMEAEKTGFAPVTLGSSILRTETAAIASVAIVGYELGARGFSTRGFSTRGFSTRGFSSCKRLLVEHCD